jgi:hypothetical protein
MTTGATIFKVAARYRGPPASANGGYICGVVARHIQQPVTVRLLRPPPLDTALELHGVEHGLWAVDDAGLRCMEARLTAPLELAIPASPGYRQAQDSSLPGSDQPDHPCPGCFVCGPQRTRGDGLRIFAGPVADRDIVAAAWLPDASLAQEGGTVAPEFLSAALDCPGYQALRTGARAWLLGELTVRVERRVRTEEPCVIVGWKIEDRGRKQTVGTALFGEDGEACAWARGIWIEPRT